MGAIPGGGKQVARVRQLQSEDGDDAGSIATGWGRDEDPGDDTWFTAWSDKNKKRRKPATTSEQRAGRRSAGTGQNEKTGRKKRKPTRRRKGAAWNDLIRTRLLGVRQDGRQPVLYDDYRAATGIKGKVDRYENRAPPAAALPDPWQRNHRWIQFENLPEHEKQYELQCIAWSQFLRDRKRDQMVLPDMKSEMVCSDSDLLVKRTALTANTCVTSRNFCEDLTREYCDINFGRGGREDQAKVRYHVDRLRRRRSERTKRFLIGHRKTFDKADEEEALGSRPEQQRQQLAGALTKHRQQLMQERAGALEFVGDEESVVRQMEAHCSATLHFSCPVLGPVVR
eukprot:g6852.t1